MFKSKFFNSISCAFALTTGIQAAVLVGYDFDDGSGSASLSPTVTGIGVASGAFGVGVGLIGPTIESGGVTLTDGLDAEGNSFGSTNGLSLGGTRNDDIGFTRSANLSTAINANDYYTFTLAPTAGNQLNLASYTFRHYIDTQIESVSSWALYSSIGGFAQANSIATGGATTVDSWDGADNKNVVDLSGAEFQGLTTPVEFRLVIFDGRNNSGSLTYWDNFIVNGVSEAVPEPSGMTLLSVGAVGLLLRRRRK